MKKKFLKLTDSDIKILGILNNINKVHKYPPHKLHNQEQLYLPYKLIEPINYMKGYTDFFHTLEIVEVESPVLERVITLEEIFPKDEMWLKYLPFAAAIAECEFPDFLCHYTDASGIIGIIQSDKFWATHFSFLNDPSELRYCKDLIVEILEKVCFDHDDLHELLKCKDSVESYIDSKELFFVSLSAAIDKLNMWRGYGNQGSGYGVVMSTREIGLKLPPEEFNDTFFVAPVIYDRKTQEEVITSKVLKVRDWYLEQKKQDSTKHWQHQAIGRLIKSCLIEIMTFKSPGFADEKEFRIISNVDNLRLESLKVKFRQRSDLVMPYVEVECAPNLGDNAGRLPVCKVICGPALDADVSIKGVRKLLTKHSRRNIEVIRSEITIRK